MEIVPLDPNQLNSEYLANDLNGSVQHVQSSSAAVAGRAKWSKTPRARGRQPRDPLAQSIQFQCSSMEDLEGTLREYLTDPSGDPVHTTLEFTFPTSAAFMVYIGDYRGGQAAEKGKSLLFGALNKTAVSVIDALAPTVDPKEQMRKQKAIAKTLAEAVQRADGFRYSFHNNWISKEDEASRFSYYCNDSTLNKGRAANEGAGTVGKKMRKPAYDCQGLLSVKFSATKQNLEVHYKHIPLHSTYEERAPPPRRGTKRWRVLELFNPEKLPQSNKRKRIETHQMPDPKPAKKRSMETSITSITSITPVLKNAVALVREDSLAPLAEFLDSADNAGTTDITEETLANQNALTSSHPNFPTEKLQVLKSNDQKVVSRPQPQKKPEKSRTPGMMSGYMTGNAIAWGQNKKDAGKHGKKSPAGTVPNQPPQSSGEASNRAKAAVAKPPTPLPSQPPLSELEILKAKLLEAERRIQRLEAEQALPPGPPGWPPGPPNGYQYPTPYPPYYHQPQHHQHSQPQQHISHPPSACDPIPISQPPQAIPGGRRPAAYLHGTKSTA